MNTIKSIRERLGVTQAALATGMGCTQGNVGHYERGQTVPPDAAGRLIDYAKSFGIFITFNDIYMPELGQATGQPDGAAAASEARVMTDDALPPVDKPLCGRSIFVEQEG